MTSKPQKKFPHTCLPFHQPGPEANTFFLSERWQDQRHYIGSLIWEIEPFLILIWAKLRKLESFQKILLDIEKNSFALHKMLENVTFNLKWYLLHLKCHFNSWWKRTDMVGSPQTHADQLHNQYRTNLVAEDAVPITEPQWTYQACNASINTIHMTTCYRRDAEFHLFQ